MWKSSESKKEETTSMTIKLLIDKTNDKVLFAEAGKDVVDFLFHILSLPLGSVVHHLTKESMSGSIGNVYGSLESLGPDYVQDCFNKAHLLDPKPAPESATNIRLLTTKASERKIVYKCGGAANSYSNNCNTYYSDCSGIKCPSTNCQGKLDKGMTYVEDEKKMEQRRLGYVKEVVTYMISDDLCVKPMSTISTTAVINQANVLAAGSLEEREVRLDMKMGLELLKTSLMSKTVLSDVFMSKKVVVTKTMFEDAKNLVLEVGSSILKKIMVLKK